MASYARMRGFKDILIMDFDIDGGTVDEIAKRIMAEKPDVIGFTCLTPRFPAILEISRRCKNYSPNVKIVLGGPHVNGVTVDILNDTAVDFGMTGESEETFTELLEAILTNPD